MVQDCKKIKLFSPNFSFNFLLKNLDTLPLLVTKKHFSSGPSSRYCRNQYREETSSNSNMRRYASVGRKVHSNCSGATSGAGDTPIRHSLGWQHRACGNYFEAIGTYLSSQPVSLPSVIHDFEGLA